MGDNFKKPKSITIDALGYLSNFLKNGLKKDLQENQIICPFCKGTGLEITDQVYGLSDDPDKRIGRFPYHNQYIASCSHCYGGIINLCEYCGKELPRNASICFCKEAEEARRSKVFKKEQEQMSKAVILRYDDEIAQKMGVLFSEEYGYDEGYFIEWEEFFEYWECEHEENDEKPKYVWGTTSDTLHLDTESILEYACEDLHENAMDNLTNIEELEIFLDDWEKKQTGTETYWWSSKYLIEIPWEL